MSSAENLPLKSVLPASLSVATGSETVLTGTPKTHVMSNGDYSVMLTSAGSGRSSWHGIAVSRWREDSTCDNWGSYIYLRDCKGGAVWSAAYQPTGAAPGSYEASFTEGAAKFLQHDGPIKVKMEVVIAPDDPAELRHVSITNLSLEPCEIELTSYMELVLSAPSDDNAAQAFSKMFVVTEFEESTQALIATRRARKPDDIPIFAAHFAVTYGASIGGVDFETDRAKFIGSGRNLRQPRAMDGAGPLSKTCGTVLDPIFSHRRILQIPAEGKGSVAFWTVMGSSRDEVIARVKLYQDAKYQTTQGTEELAAAAESKAEVTLKRLGIQPSDCDAFQCLAKATIYADAAFRPSSDELRRGPGGAPVLWAHGISGDVPIIVLRVSDSSDLKLARQMLSAHDYFGAKQLPVDLVILNDKPPPAEELHAAILAMVQDRHSPKPEKGCRGAIFVLQDFNLAHDSRKYLMTVARAVINPHEGGNSSHGEDLGALLKALQAKKSDVWRPEALEAHLKKTHEKKSMSAAEKTGLPPLPKPDAYRELAFFNGYGGFTQSGDEYVIILNDAHTTPAPWINVIANPKFGFQVSALGSGYSWAINSQQYTLTPWSNDPVSDASGEIIYVRDNDSGDLWGPTALPIREKGSPYIARHGHGYSKFEHTSHEIHLELLQFVAAKDSIKLSRLKIVNKSHRRRHLSVTAYVEWVMGNARSTTYPYITTEIDAETGALLAQNLANADFPGRIAFLDLAGQQLSWTGDRTEFLGNYGTPLHPFALSEKKPLSKKTGAGFDPCAALQTEICLEPNAIAELTIFLGDAPSKLDAISLIRKFRAADLGIVFNDVTYQWNEMLAAVQVKTPEPSMDLMLNRWLPYQVLACRVWARAAFYQASGAYGFRDQLQDVLALCISKPEVTREHILRAASRQFLEGDFNHWWLPETEKGIRTRIADDKAWLPFVVAEYIRITGDSAILDDEISFIEGPVLKDGEKEAYFAAKRSDKTANLYVHCTLALDQSLSLGSHGLPLMGTGDWNDGMNRIGEKGTGESIWLGWFFYKTMDAFAKISEARGDKAHAEKWRTFMVMLKEALEKSGWDGAWYRRAYYDDGAVLGSSTNDECQIDAIAQSWSVISGAAPRERGAAAMHALESHLIDTKNKLALLFTPPFDHAKSDPGYIKGYPPGLRENGGQYTHGAIWSILAFAMLGEGDKAGDLFKMLNPITHAGSEEDIQRYKVEPYVICADLYSVAPHVGRGGWTWYTGSGGWMYRAGLEYILGFRLEGATLRINPTIPKSWPGFDITFRYHATRYDIHVDNTAHVSCGVKRLELDDVECVGSDPHIDLRREAGIHKVTVTLG